MVFFEKFINNTVIQSAIFSWFFAQFLKIVIEIIKKNKFNSREDLILRVLFGTGGMPSSHSATICAVAVAIGIKEGFDSSIFAFSLVLVLIVIRDATGVRLSTGRQAEVINTLLENQKEHHNIEFVKIKEVKGHTPLETFVGAFVGIIVSLGLSLLNN